MLRKYVLLFSFLIVCSLVMGPPKDEIREVGSLPQLPSVFTNDASAETMGAITLTPGDFEIGVGDIGQLRYSVDGAYGATSVAWTSSDAEIATVGAGGVVTAHAEGECVMHGRSYGGHTAEAIVRVLPAPSVLIVSPASVRLGRGEVYAITPIISAGSRTSYTYTSSNTAVADVDEYGRVHAKKNGSVIVTVKTHNGVKDTLNVTVLKPPTSIRFKTETIVAYVGESVAAPVKLASGEGAIVRYTSSDPSVAHVDSMGRVAGIAAGEAIITAVTFNGETDACPVVVYDPPTRIVAPEWIDAVAGIPMDFSIGAQTQAGDAYAGDIDIDCADPDIACVTDGVLYPLRRGETYITLTAHRISMRVHLSVTRYGDNYATRIVAHRGGRGNGTENTLSAIQGAVRDGADAIEIDVRMTKDGELVLMHDSSINRTSYSTGFVSRMTLEQLQSVNFKGYPICTLDEALSYLSGTSVSLLLEMKITGIENACVEAVTRAGMEDRTTFISFSLNALRTVRMIKAGALVGYLYIADIKDPVGVADIFGIDLMLPYSALVDEAYVADLHNAGVRVGVWTVNKRSSLSAAHRAGVDYIITDQVATALAVLER